MPPNNARDPEANQELVSYANQILKMIDNGQSAQVWDDMSAVGKKVVTRSAFEKKSTERSTLGTPKSRRTVSLSGNQSNGQHELPAGTYFNVRYLTQFSGSQAPKIELVSFH